MPKFTKNCLLVILLCCAFGVHTAPPEATPLAISHRACMTECPENTLPAIAWAADVGADLIEIDLRATRDGELVVIHDKTVNRTTNGRGRVNNLTLDEISALDAGNGKRVPTMDEAFAFIRTTELGLLLDLKDVKGINPETVYAALVRHELQQRVVIGARSIDQLIAFKTLNPDMTAMAFTKNVGLIPSYIENDADIIRLWARWVRSNPQLIEDVRKLGREVWVTTGAIRGTELASLMERDIQGLITDYPSDVLEQREPLKAQAKRTTTAAISNRAR